LGSKALLALPAQTLPLSGLLAQLALLERKALLGPLVQILLLLDPLVQLDPLERKVLLAPRAPQVPLAQ